MKNKYFRRKLISLTAALSISVCAVSMPASAEWVQIGYMGDLNNDAEVNIADLVLMSKYILAKTQLTSENAYNVKEKFYSINGSEADNSLEYLQTSDINQDGRTDVFDLILMRKYIINQWSDPVYIWNDETESTTESTTEETSTTSTTSLTSTSLTTTTISSTDIMTTTSTTAFEFIEAPVKDLYGSMPSQNNAEMVVFYVDFPDCPYPYEPTTAEIEKAVFGAEDTTSKSYPFESISAFYKRSSKGSLNINGKVFRYTTKENKSAYEGDIYHVNLINEVFEAFRDSEDFSIFDSNGDKIIDSTLISVPTAAGDDNWWPAAGQYGGSSDFKVDDMSVGHVIVGNAQIESKSDHKNFTSSYLHEIGHCMGLPDYYLYNGEKDFEGLHGSAGYEMMDETNADFSAVSKLMLGWYKREQVSIYDPTTKTQSFTLNNAQKENGNCIIIPCGKLENNYYSEFLILEYTTLDVNNSRLKKDYWWRTSGAGVRVFHVEGTVTDNIGWKYWKYASGENEATNNDDGRRFIRIIDDTETDNLYHAGDVIDSNITGFKWYAEDGTQSVDTGIKITVDSMESDNCIITVSEK
ncbi:MAG: dockerin type I domain-containing protein [Prevotella sp.]|nr:dockerin type I domain-containing protein [Alistipes senegalensis]MCM1357182.1 dockerin type I domain-containing protein [Prevotella sp.]MCM1472965.1 dockerin type I domain-containing protein [Muribaculaceae bacterium]